MNKWLDIIQLSALVATSLGVGIAAYQIWQTKKQSITSFEDDFTRQYRDIIQRIPVKALLNENLSDDDFQMALNEIYNYIDLTNYQIFLRKQNRIRSQTWEILRDGMKANLELPAFKRGWEMIKERTPDNFFEELRCLEISKFETDPKSWKDKDIREYRKTITGADGGKNEG
ncbi:MAG: hypothetical protein ACQ9MH_26020 [Nitrospinales bacterium]